MTYEKGIPDYAMVPAKEMEERVIVPITKGAIYSPVQVTNITEKPKTTITLEEDILVPDTKPDLREILMIDGKSHLAVKACPCKKIVSPAMNHNMYHNPIVQDNLSRLSSFGYEILSPGRGMLANGDEGDGRMPDEAVLFQHILKETAFEKDLSGKKILVTAGATRESIDPVRFITNHSSGKMGRAIARAAAFRGAEVTFIFGHMDAEPPMFVKKIPVLSAANMFEEVSKRAEDQDIIIKAAAVADYTPAQTAQGKIKKAEGDMAIPLKRTRDILKWLGEHRRPNQIICGFSMETENLLDNSKKKLISKNCDMICANSLSSEGSGFGSDTNVITLITEGGMESLEKMSKDEAAHIILDRLIKL